MSLGGTLPPFIVMRLHSQTCEVLSVAPAAPTGCTAVFMSLNVDHYESQDQHGPNRAVIGATGLLALLTASCCILPIGLSIIGLGGSWLAMLGPFVEYRVEILAVAGPILGWSWFRLWRRWNCASKRRSALFIVGFATFSVAIAASSPLWEEEAARTMWTLWQQTR